MTEHDRLLQFLRSLPTEADYRAWCEAFKICLVGLLPEIDHLIVAVAHTRKLNPQDATITIHQQIYLDRSTGTSARTRQPAEQPDTPRWKALVAQGRHSERVFLDAHHEPIGIDCFDANGVYCGSVVLFRKKFKRPISPESVALFEGLGSFLAFVMSDFVLRLHNASPWIERYRNIIDIIEEDAELSDREREILALLMVCQSTEEIADALCVSRHTVSHHTTRLYRKLGVTSWRDIVARYFTPFVPPQN